MLAAASALLVGTSWLLFDFSHRFLAEVPFTFWLMLFLCCAESTAAGWRGRLALAGLVLAGAAVELTRGNGVILVPAIAGTLLVTRSFERVLPGAVRVEPAGRVLLIGALLMPLVAWHVRSARVSYPGFQGGSQVEFVLARHGPETAPAVAGEPPAAIARPFATWQGAHTGRSRGGTCSTCPSQRSTRCCSC